MRSHPRLVWLLQGPIIEKSQKKSCNRIVTSLHTLTNAEISKKVLFVASESVLAVKFPSCKDTMFKESKSTVNHMKITRKERNIRFSSINLHDLRAMMNARVATSPIST